jgi:hypothetical protein
VVISLVRKSIERKASADVDWNLKRSSKHMIEPKVENQHLISNENKPGGANACGKSRKIFA